MPTRFEATFADPGGVLWAAAQHAIGLRVTAELEDGSVPLRVWGRRLTRTHDSTGTLLTLFGFDDSYRLHAVPQLRSFGPASLASVASTLAGEAELRAKTTGLSGRVVNADSPLVQYRETALQFLRRHARSVGQDVWPYRGELYVGPGPGNGKTITLDLDDGRGIGEFVLEESWLDEAGGDQFPRTGAAFKGGLDLKAGGSDGTAIKPSDRRDVFQKLGLSEPFGWPAGTALAGGDPATLAKATAAARAAARTAGTVPFYGPPPDGLKPGATADLMFGTTTLANGLRVAGITHVVEGGARRTDVQFGRPADFDDPLPDLRPAWHLWAATTAGSVDPRVASVPVKPIGWHPKSKPLAARLLCGAAPPKGGTVRRPVEGELLLIGFEGGVPDAPVVLGSLHDSTAPDPAGVDWVLRLPGGGELRATAADGKILVALKGVELSVTADKVLTLKAPEIRLDQ